MSDCYEKTKVDGFDKVAEDVWMYLRVEDVKLKNACDSEVSVSKIGLEQKEEYLKTFKKAFGNPEDVYGVLDDGYLVVEERFFKDKNGFVNSIFIAKVNGSSVGVVRTVTKGDLCFVYALAVDKDYRKGGKVAKTIGKIAIEDAFDLGAKTLILQTESGSALERLYSQIGFKKMFTGTYYKPLKD